LRRHDGDVGPREVVVRLDEAACDGLVADPPDDVAQTFGRLEVEAKVLDLRMRLGSDEAPDVDHGLQVRVRADRS
jgi:hypothetical protein